MGIQDYINIVVGHMVSLPREGYLWNTMRETPPPDIGMIAGVKPLRCCVDGTYEVKEHWKPN